MVAEVGIWCSVPLLERERKQNSRTNVARLLRTPTVRVDHRAGDPKRAKKPDARRSDVGLGTRKRVSGAGNTICGSERSKEELTKSPRRLRRRLGEAWQCDRNSGSTSRQADFALLCENRSQKKSTRVHGRQEDDNGGGDDVPRAWSSRSRTACNRASNLAFCWFTFSFASSRSASRFWIRSFRAMSLRSASATSRFRVEFWSTSCRGRATRPRVSQSGRPEQRRRGRAHNQLTCFCTIVSWSMLRVKKSILRCCVLLFEFLARLR